MGGRTSWLEANQLTGRLALYSAKPQQFVRQSSFFFQNEDIFVQLDKLVELDKITHAWIGFNYSLTQAQKTF